jgi:Fe-S oxidoreductase
VLTLAELVEGLDLPVPSLAGVEVVAQPHCHHASVLGWAADRRLLERAGATVTQVAGCCGLAGNFGMEQGHYEVSVAVAETHLLPAVRANPDAVVLADGMSCRVQLDDLAGVRAVHLADLLAPRLEA